MIGGIIYIIGIFFCLFILPYCVKEIENDFWDYFIPAFFTAVLWPGWLLIGCIVGLFYIPFYIGIKLNERKYND